MKFDTRLLAAPVTKSFLSITRQKLLPTTCDYHRRWPAPLPGTLRQVTPGGAYRLRAHGTTTATTTRVINGGSAAVSGKRILQSVNKNKIASGVDQTYLEKSQLINTSPAALHAAGSWARVIQSPPANFSSWSAHLVLGAPALRPKPSFGLQLTTCCDHR